MGKISLVADTVHGSICISNIEKEILAARIFNRLHNVSQNSTVYLTFPSNRTKRFEHSLGTMYLSGQMFYYGMLNAEEQTIKNFFEQLNVIVQKTMRDTLNSDNQLYKANIHDRFYRIEELTKYNEAEFLNKIDLVDEWIPHKIHDEEKYLYMAIIQSIRLAGLMHDVGHPPFSHIAENAMKEMWIDISNLEPKSDYQLEYFDALSDYFQDEGELHEKIGNRITERLLSTLQIPMPNARTEQQRNELPKQLYRIMIKEFTSAILDEKNDFFRSLHSIVSGAFDADRLDYVTRDIQNSGLNAGKIEYDRLLPTIKMIQKDKLFYFCPSIKCINGLEDFFNRRWNLYKTVIFHHRAIKTDYLLKDCIFQLLKRNLMSNPKNSGDQNSILPYDISGLWKAVQKSSSDDYLFQKLGQWDDGWLMVVLKKSYFELDDRQQGDLILKDKLEELIAGTKHYYSVLKNNNTFGELDNSAAKSILKNISQIETFLKETKEKNDNQSDNRTTINIDPFCNDVQELITLTKRYERGMYRENGFILGRISRLIYDNYFDDGSFKKLVTQSVEQIVIKDVRDTVVEFKTIKSGIQEGLFLYRRDNELVEFQDVSNTTKNLKVQRDYVQPFYIYINTDAIENLDLKSYRIQIGEIIGQNIILSLGELFKKMI